ncbi:hypothetical protein RA281_28085, partial [Pseudomonas syringae pv. tagetis]
SGATGSDPVLHRGPQYIIDPILPARAIFLEKGQHIAVDLQRNQLLGIRQRRPLDSLFQLLLRGFEQRFGGIHWIDRSAGRVCHRCH